jgi:hypothetical protein
VAIPSQQVLIPFFDFRVVTYSASQNTWTQVLQSDKHRIGLIWVNHSSTVGDDHVASPREDAAAAWFQAPIRIRQLEMLEMWFRDYGVLVTEPWYVNKQGSGSSSGVVTEILFNPPR